jgi:Ca2+-transporting ATPase
VSLVVLVMIVLATELPGLQHGLLTTSLTGRQWMACLGLAAVLPATIEAAKWVRRRDAAAPPPPIDAGEAVSPARART